MLISCGYLPLLRSANYATLVTARLIVVASHMVIVSSICHASIYLLFIYYYFFIYLYVWDNLGMDFVSVVMQAGLGLPDTDAWYMIETIAEKQKVVYKQFVSQSFYLGVSLTSNQISEVPCCPLLVHLS